MLTEPERPTRTRLLLFASGDFAFNLYWQSVMLFLLFYYTDAIRLPVETAALTYLIASIWDGIVNLIAGMVVDAGGARRGHSRWLVLGAAPLGLSFAVMYLPPPDIWWAAGAVLVGHILFRTAYAFVNVPYLAMSARISQDSGDRALVAGMRVLFGTAALFVVTQGLMRIGGGFAAGDVANAYFAAAIAFGIVGTILLVMVGITVRELPVADRTRPPSLAACVASLAGNRAFLTLSAAMMAMVAASTVLNKSVLYYYKYLLNDEASGRDALGMMGLAGVVAVPIWIVARRRLGNRGTWFLATTAGVAILATFAIARPGDTMTTHPFMMGLQMAMTGLNIIFWAMLPNTIEYGERTTGLRVEGTVFGVAALLQRVAIGAATGLLGVALGSVGYVANVPQGPATLEGIRWSIILLPIGFFALSGVLMWFNPLTRNAHAAIVAELTQRRESHED
ncbi:MAG: glycoside-pentoside-hexuronide (GPH):cation symporter [Sphingomonas sp.]